MQGSLLLAKSNFTNVPSYATKLFSSSFLKKKSKSCNQGGKQELDLTIQISLDTIMEMYIQLMQGLYIYVVDVVSLTQSMKIN